MSTQRVMPGGWVAPEELQKTEEGRTLCRWCALEIPPGRRRTFCSPYCVHEWKLRTDPGYMRERVFERDRGVCSVCRIDCHNEWNRLRRMPAAKRVLALAEWGVKPRTRKSLWDADHVTPVSEGGGECDLANMRTLCLKCHRAVTAALRERRKAVVTSRASLPSPQNT